MKIVEANTTVTSNINIAIVVARFNNFINKILLDGAVDTLKRIGQVKEENITIIWVPGAYELPLTTHVLAKSSKYDAIIALGTIMRGDTAHFEYIAGETIAGISNVAILNEIPITLGVLTIKNIKQAIERSGMKSGNKGNEAALTALEMINVLKILKNNSL